MSRSRSRSGSLTVRYTEMESPLGPLLLTSDGTSLTGLYMDSQRHGPVRGEDWLRDDDAAPFVAAREQLTAFFRGELQDFDLPLRARGTAFQQRVWDELKKIPYGVTVSYGEVARRIGQPAAVRAVGLANGRNPLGIVVPCHRVIGANGSMTGYGGGLPRKVALLRFEAAVLAGGPRPFLDQETELANTDTGRAAQMALFNG